MPELYNDYDEYHEPSEADELFKEIKQKILDNAKQSIKREIETLRDENKRLRDNNQALDSKVRELERTVKDYESNKEQIRKIVETDFYNATVAEALQKALDPAVVWYAQYTPTLPPKCKLCDDDRKLHATFPDGTETTTGCKCAKPLYSYKPCQARVYSLEYHKAVKPSHQSNRKCYIRKRYATRYATTGGEAHDCHEDFHIDKIYSEFTDEVKSLNLGYGESVGFETKEECQKHCDWLNSEKE